MPQYAARLLRAAIVGLGQPCVVIGSKPTVPIEGIEEALEQTVIWVNADKPVSWRELGLDVPDIYFQSGWAYPAFSALGKEVKSKGGRICLLMDNNWRENLRQLIGAIWFRIFKQKQFNAVLVPGKSSRKLARWYGISNQKIWEGMYGADPDLFYNGAPLEERPKRIIFVGQYIHRKQCLELARAFMGVADQIPEWELVMYGSGDQQSLLPVHPRIKVNDFTQPQQLAGIYRNARIFALPSLSEAWGLVVHEAALSGCQLLLSDAIGSRHDFASQENAQIFKAGNLRDLQSALLKLTSLNSSELKIAQQTSLTLAKSHGPSIFSKNITAICRNI
jgi:glycosyltransferase involved in cell wall biosynthesis